MFSKGPKKPNEAFMNRREISLWLGRSLSTSEVTLRVVQQLVGIIEYQQQVIQALSAGLPTESSETLLRGVGPDGDGSPMDIMKKLADIEAQLTPVLQAVDQACTQLEKEL
jgi:hypothetical protein